MESISFIVEDNFANQRIDKVITLVYPQYTRNHIQKIIQEGGVTVNGKVVDKSHNTSAGSKVELITPETQQLYIVAQEIPLDIRYEDNDLLVVNKPRGMVVHPAAGNLDGTLVNALMNHCKSSLSGINGVIRPGIVHRIDKDTSGLLLVAKNDFAHNSLAAQLRAHSITREYRAVVHGRLKQTEGTIDAPIGRSAKDRKKMCVTDKNSKKATTHYTLIEQFEDYSYIKLRLETGRTHQIRVHMASIGHPVAGDLVYGPKNGVKLLNGQCLHAALLGFLHPKDGRYIEITAELPDYFENFLRRIKS
ncbi:MAG: RluA family pseudouridine synthase [Eubacteriales bacterium]